MRRVEFQAPAVRAQLRTHDSRLSRLTPSLVPFPRRRTMNPTTVKASGALFVQSKTSKTSTHQAENHSDYNASGPRLPPSASSSPAPAAPLILLFREADRTSDPIPTPATATISAAG